MQINHITRRPYERGNQAMLAEQKAACLYQSDEWLTFRQARAVGRTVKKGEHGIILGRVLEDRDEQTNRKRRAFKRFVVFNLDQTLPANVHDYAPSM